MVHSIRTITGSDYTDEYNVDGNGNGFIGDYTFRWTVNGVPCPLMFEDILVARLPDAMVANAGTDITQCGSTAMLSGNYCTEYECMEFRGRT